MRKQWGLAAGMAIKAMETNGASSGAGVVAHDPNANAR
jgi:hypothetical protein